MDSVFAITGKDFIILAADQSQARSVIIMKSDEDKITELDSHKLFGVSGPNGDRVNFSEYIKKNLKLYELRHNQKLSTKAAAHFTRRELADSLRTDPYQVKILLAGYDEEDGSSLYYIDELASMHKVKYAAHGYASLFLSGLLDRYWKEDLERDECIDIIQKCINELRTRFLINAQKYTIKIVSKDGIEVVNNDQE